MSKLQTYRLRAPASGREAVEAPEPGYAYRDRETGEDLKPVSVVLPLVSASGSSLLRTPENLQACDRCDQLIGIDLADCPYCARRQS